MAFRRPHTLGFHGMVVSPHPLATLAGARALQNGGNAVDAAVATNAVLAVVHPHMCGLGGDAFFLLHSARERRVLALNASGRAPGAATREAVRARGHGAMPTRGPLTITVPGAVDGWAEALRRCGTMGLKDLLAPAIRCARDGVPMTPEIPLFIEQNRDLLLKSPPAARTFLERGTSRGGDRLVNADLARSLERIAEGGAEALYRGTLGRDLVRGLAPQGALLAEEDLRAHRSDWVDPLHVRYRGHDVYQCPPNSQGIALLLMLNLLGGFDLAGMWGDEVARLHLMIEAKKLAFADRDRYVTDPAFVPVPTDRLLSPTYADARRRLIARHRAMPLPAPSGDLDGDTICLCTADGAGN
ncbi:MAG TPA: gamma-glutamyltransferase, partial [Candidatus Methylomirabilis sp.]